MKLPNAHQMRAIEAYTIQESNITSTELMERAATEAARFVQCRYPQQDRPVVIFAGPGNNGGDGLAMARLLHVKG